MAWTALPRASSSSRSWRRAASSTRSSRTSIMVPHGDRGGVPIEPFLTDQWYVNAAELAKPAIASVREGRTKFVPKTWEKTYFDWMENIQPWCISRQLWWGHQIPAWYGPDGTIFVAKTEEGSAGRRGPVLPRARRPVEGLGRGEAGEFRTRRDPDPRRGRARHLVLLGAVAVLDARLAGEDAGTAPPITRPTFW